MPPQPGSASSRRYRAVVAAALFQCAAAPGSHRLPSVVPSPLRRPRAPQEHPSPVVPKPNASPPLHVSTGRASSRPSTAPFARRRLLAGPTAASRAVRRAAPSPARAAPLLLPSRCTCPAACSAPVLCLFCAVAVT
ncbi:hypothetical protein E2562_017037 [Oryza meyeriana var. granulata]|uniref:Uncharacterized protein n=1 Tax=Oryza meyeriana var. granulata TaxID=110450 RepID=A0A6G1F8L9_9ORYZ|nr:hypothetical protein E2562_017037 [Oryza meyeriana var. granulata]